MLRLSANLSTMFGELPFLERFDAARRSGMEAVEVQYPYAHSVVDVSAAIRDANLELVLINAPRGSRASDRGLACMERREEEFRDSIELALFWSKTLGNRFIHVLSGIPGEENPREVCIEVWRSNMNWAAAKAREANIELLIEAINPTDVPGYFIRSLNDAVSLLDMVDGTGVGLLFDVYHCARAGEPIVAQIHACASLTRHVQIADSPSRGEPGSGDIDWSGVFSAIKATGYSGFVGMEYTPRAGTLEGLAWVRPFLEES